MPNAVCQPVRGRLHRALCPCDLLCPAASRSQAKNGSAVRALGGVAAIADGMAASKVCKAHRDYWNSWHA